VVAQGGGGVEAVGSGVAGGVHRQYCRGFVEITKLQGFFAVAKVLSCKRDSIDLTLGHHGL